MSEEQAPQENLKQEDTPDKFDGGIKESDLKQQDFVDELSEICFHAAETFVGGYNLKKTVKTGNNQMRLFRYIGIKGEFFVIQVGKNTKCIEPTTVSGFDFIDKSWLVLPDALPIKNMQVLPSRPMATQAQFLSAQVGVPNAQQDGLIKPSITGVVSTQQVAPAPATIPQPTVQQFAGGSKVTGKPKSKPTPRPMEGE